MSEKGQEAGSTENNAPTTPLNENKSPDRALPSSSTEENASSETKDADKEKSPQRPESPEPNCSICLGKLQNKSFTDSCLHTFCFTCLLEWSKVKAVCPLCQQPFKSIIHNVQSIDKYDQYEIRHHQRPSHPVPDELATGGRFRYRTTLTNERWMQRHERETSRQLCLLQRPSSLTTRYNWRHLRQTSTSDFRRRVYENGMRVQEVEAVPGRPVRQRNISPDFFRRNPACTHRLVPWLNRELNVLVGTLEDQVQMVLELIMDIIQRFEIGGEVFRTHLESFLGRRTDHFVHEFMHFARSPFDMCSYDQHAVYEVNPDSIDPLSILTVDSSSDSDDEEGDNNNNNEDNDIIMLSPSEMSGPLVSNDHSYFSRPSNPEPPAERSGLSDHLYTTPMVRGFISEIESEPGHSGWESPMPGPSTLVWSPPHPCSPTALNPEPAILECVAGESATTTNPNTEDEVRELTTEQALDESDAESIIVTGYEKPYDERTPERVPISSDEDDDLRAALAASRIAQVVEAMKLKEEEEKRRQQFAANSQQQSLPTRTSRSRSTSSHRNRRSSSRHRSRDRNRRDRSKDRRRRSRSRSARRGARRSQSRDRFGHRSRSPSRDRFYSYFYTGTRRSRRSRSGSSHRYTSSRYSHRSGSSGIEVIGEKAGDRGYRGYRRDERRRRHRSGSRDSIEVIESESSRSRRKRSRRSGDRSPPSRRRESSKEKTTTDKDSSTTNTTTKQRKKQEKNTQEMPVLLTKIKVEPTECKKHPTGHKSSSSLQNAVSAVPSSSASTSTASLGQGGTVQEAQGQDSSAGTQNQREGSGRNATSSSTATANVTPQTGASKNATSITSQSVDKQPRSSESNKSKSSKTREKDSRKKTTEKEKSRDSSKDKRKKSSERETRERHKSKERSSDKDHSSSRGYSSWDSHGSRDRSDRRSDRRLDSYSSTRHESSSRSSRHVESSSTRSYNRYRDRSEERDERLRSQSDKSSSRKDNQDKSKKVSESKKDKDSSSTTSASTSRRATTAGLAAELRKAAMKAASAASGKTSSASSGDLHTLEKSLRENITKRLKNKPTDNNDRGKDT